MIRHIVLVRLREIVPHGEAAAIFAGLADLRRHLPGMLSFDFGANVSAEGLAKGHTHAFTVDFADAAARDAYLASPEHEAAGARLVRAAEGGLAGLTVLDLDLGRGLVDRTTSPDREAPRPGLVHPGST